MRVVIPGGSGQVGIVLARAFTGGSHDVVIVSRSPVSSRPWREVGWDGLTREIDGADVVVNLAGRSVNCRYGAANRREILESRVETTRAVGAAIAAAAVPPRVWLQASTATIYAHRFDAPNDDVTGILGGREPDAPDTWNFSIDVAQAWEAAADETPLPRTRLVKLRSAMIMNPDRGSIFDTLLALVRRGLGGTAASGRQFISWIHHADFVAACEWLITHDELSGPISIAAPNPLPNREFMRVLREAWGARIGLPATRWMLEIGAFLMRSETELILKSRRVVPRRLTDSRFAFRYPEWPEAARALCGEWRALQSAPHGLQDTARGRA